MKKLIASLSMGLFATITSTTIVACETQPTNPVDQGDFASEGDSIVKLLTTPLEFEGETYSYNGEVSTSKKYLPDTNTLSGEKGKDSVEFEYGDAVEIDLTGEKKWYEDNLPDIDFDSLDPLDTFGLVDTSTSSRLSPDEGGSYDGWLEKNQLLWSGADDVNNDNEYTHTLTPVEGKENQWTLGGTYYKYSFTDPIPDDDVMFETSEVLWTLIKLDALHFILQYTPSQTITHSIAAYYYIAAYECDAEGNKVEASTGQMHKITTTPWLFADNNKITNDVDSLPTGDSLNGWSYDDIVDIYQLSGFGFGDDSFAYKFLIGNDGGGTTYNAMRFLPMGVHKDTIWYYLASYVDDAIDGGFENHSQKVSLTKVR